MNQDEMIHKKRKIKKDKKFTLIYYHSKGKLQNTQ